MATTKLSLPYSSHDFVPKRRITFEAEMGTELLMDMRSENNIEDLVNIFVEDFKKQLSQGIQLSKLNPNKEVIINSSFSTQKMISNSDGSMGLQFSQVENINITLIGERGCQ